MAFPGILDWRRNAARHAVYRIHALGDGGDDSHHLRLQPYAQRFGDHPYAFGSKRNLQLPTAAARVHRANEDLLYFSRAHVRCGDRRRHQIWTEESGAKSLS